MGKAVENCLAAIHLEFRFGFVSLVLSLDCRHGFS